MDTILPTLPLAARRALGALAAFNPPWNLSGRAALWRWLRRVPRSLEQLDFVWHGLDRLDEVHDQVVRTLAAAGLDMATLYGDSQRLSLGARDRESVCLLSLTAEPGPPLAPPQETRLAGVKVTMAGLREVAAAILCSLHKRPDRQYLENAGLLIRNGVSLNQGLEDACERNPDLVPQGLGLRLARFEIEDPELSELARRRLRRHQERVVFEILACSVPKSHASWGR